MKTVKTGRELGDALRLIAKYTEKDFVTILRKLALEGFRELIVRSARDTGYLRSNWDVTVDVRPSDKPLKHPSPGKGNFANAPMPVLTSVKAGSIIVLYNNTEYAINLEHGTAHQRAQPMIVPTYQMLLQMAKNLADELSKRNYDV